MGQPQSKLRPSEEEPPPPPQHHPPYRTQQAVTPQGVRNIGEFHLTSPCSELSDPSYRKPPTRFVPEKHQRILILENVPQQSTRPNAAHRLPPRPRENKGKKKKGTLRKQAAKIMTGCLQESANKIDRVQLATRQVVSQQPHKNQDLVVDNDEVPPPRKEQIKACFQGCFQETTHQLEVVHQVVTTHFANPNKLAEERRMVVYQPKEQSKRVAWNAHVTEEGGDATPPQLLSSNMVHQEDVYFDRLAALQQQSPFVPADEGGTYFSAVHTVEEPRRDPRMMLETPGTADVYLDDEGNDVEDSGIVSMLFGEISDSEEEESVGNSVDSATATMVNTVVSENEGETVTEAVSLAESGYVNTVVSEESSLETSSILEARTLCSDPEEESIGACSKTLEAQPRGCKSRDMAQRDTIEVETVDSATEVTSRRVSNEEEFKPIIQASVPTKKSNGPSLAAMLIRSRIPAPVPKNEKQAKPAPTAVLPPVQDEAQATSRKNVSGCGVQRSARGITRSQPISLQNQSQKSKQEQPKRAIFKPGSIKAPVAVPTDKILPSHSLEQAVSYDSDELALRVTESAPSVLETRDYRNIALASSVDEESLRALKPTMPYAASSTHKNLALMSPSANSICSSVGPSPGPLVSNEAMSNAAFLFSPSYVGGKPMRIRHAKPQTRNHTFTICTAASRSRLSAASSRSLPAFSIPVSSAPQNPPTNTASSMSYDGTNVKSAQPARISSTNIAGKHVRFSAVNEQANSAPTRHSAPMVENIDLGIESKMSELTDATGVYDDDSISARDEEETTKSPSTVSTTSSRSSIHWTYRNENGKLGAATPLKKGDTSAKRATTTKSPFLRFQAAKTRFSKPAEKRTPARKTPPKKFTQRKSTGGGGVVSSRISELNVRLRSARQPVWKNPRRETGGEDTLAPRKATLVNPLFRNSSHTSEEAGQKSEPITQEQNIYNQQPVNPTTEEAPKRHILSAASMQHILSAPVENVDDVSVSSAESEDIFATLVKTDEPLLGHTQEDGSVGSAESEEEDPFADIMQGRSSVDSSPVVSSNVQRKLSLGTSSRSLVSEESCFGVVSRSSSDASTVRTRENRRRTVSTIGGISLSTFESSSMPTVVADDKENGPYLPLSTNNKKVQVNPYEQRQARGSLCLSPKLGRTPMQARKWRTLAAAAQEKDRLRNEKKQSRRGLKERNSNVCQ